MFYSDFCQVILAELSTGERRAVPRLVHPPPPEPEPEWIDWEEFYSEHGGEG